MVFLFRKHFQHNIANYFTAASLDRSEESKYFFFQSDHKTQYANQYVWPYIERDVIFSLLANSFVIAHLDSFEPLEQDGDIRDFYPNIQKQNGEYVVVLGVNDRRFLTNIMEGQGEFWSYGDLINLKSFPASEFAGYSSVDLPILYNTANYKLHIRPIGDDIGFSICLNPQLQDSEEILTKIRTILNEYHVKLEYREIEKVEEYSDE